MDLSIVDDRIKESIDYIIGLPVSTSTLEVKYRAVSELERLLLQSKLEDKDLTIECVRKLVSECSRLLSFGKKLEQECSLHDRDRESMIHLMNEADKRAKDAEVRNEELDEKMKGLSEELVFYKCNDEKLVADTSPGTTTQDTLLESILGTLVNEENAAYGRLFVEANRSNESCQKLLEMWNSLKPSTQKVMSIAAQLKIVETEKEHLKMSLCKAEELVNNLSAENTALELDHKKLLSMYYSVGSTEVHRSSTPPKSKWKFSTMMNYPVEKKIDFTVADMDIETLPPSPIHHCDNA
ncbi:uncharacterized protein LOC115699502 [Cannabis sativa]|uniref:Uncharacterized protein n=2 Tax=Cannabis sativa TaxID=3483 RepID=A0AB40E8P7_CANSA|nr:uncharacterized protein LOC115699502 [Cannabis sativa]KAF4372932.1 hypothetical protein G4B88_018097 [Cannabis sativa]KAF4373138.1 hypothetical protein F8388_019320 [Cannabis sativa]